MCFYRSTSSNHFDFTGFLTCGPNQSVTLIVYKFDMNAHLEQSKPLDLAGLTCLCPRPARRAEPN